MLQTGGKWGTFSDAEHGVFQLSAPQPLFSLPWLKMMRFSFFFSPWDALLCVRVVHVPMGLHGDLGG